MDGLEIQPLTPDRWDDLVELFGERGAYGGCWCMWWRQTSAEFSRGCGDGNRRAFQAIVQAGRVPGLVAHHSGRPVGWVAVAPRAELGRIERSPVLRPPDDRPAWSVSCFFVDRSHRRRRIAAALLDAAVAHARSRGAALVEAYPVDRLPGQPVDAFTGSLSLFRSAGFEEAARRRPQRPIVRLELPGG